MKKVVFGLIATVILSLSVNAQQSKLSSEIGKTHLTPKTVGTYSASSNGCWGWSFCLNTPWENSSLTGTTSQTLNSNNTMTFKIRIASTNAENIKFYKGKTTFELKNSSPMQVGEYKLFGLKSTATYVPGVYPLVNDGTYITFTVKFQQ
ncbi:MAG: hypothetical protein J0L86_03520 [Flavobacteriales bacterium]|nr:hypothetical protein [Flavobacteriales bacterium]